MALLQYLLPLFLLPAVSCVANSSEVCTPEEIANCSCFSYLVEQVRENDKNLFEIENTFLPPDTTPPAFVKVTYNFQDAGKEENGTESWVWSTSTIYLWQSFNVLHYTSLLFADDVPLAGVNLTLPLQCKNASDVHKQLLTQRVSSQCLCAGNGITIIICLLAKSLCSPSQGCL